MSEPDDPPFCECCESPDPVGGLVSYTKADGMGARWLCDLCANTLAGTSLDHLRAYGEVSPILKTICYVGNQLRKDIAGGRP